MQQINSLTGTRPTNNDIRHQINTNTVGVVSSEFLSHANFYTDRILQWILLRISLNIKNNIFASFYNYIKDKNLSVLNVKTVLKASETVSPQLIHYRNIMKIQSISVMNK